MSAEVRGDEIDLLRKEDAVEACKEENDENGENEV